MVALIARGIALCRSPIIRKIEDTSMEGAHRADKVPFSERRTAHCNVFG